MIELRKEIKKPKSLIRSATSQELLEYRSLLLVKKLEDALNKQTINGDRNQNKYKE